MWKKLHFVRTCYTQTQNVLSLYFEDVIVIHISVGFLWKVFFPWTQRISFRNVITSLLLCIEMTKIKTENNIQSSAVRRHNADALIYVLDVLKLHLWCDFQLLTWWVSMAAAVWCTAWTPGLGEHLQTSSHWSLKPWGTLGRSCWRRGGMDRASVWS